ncbi:MAG: asparaginase domain-containing protein [bacterium]
MAIRIFVTGGTFDKVYDELDGRLHFSETHVPEMLRLGRSRADVELSVLMMIDSLEMTEADRETLVQNCRSCAEARILITHGTDTMEKTAQVLGRSVRDKTIVLTGAMIPYEFGSSDGLFNLGAALAFAQTLPAGVYIAMNGRCFNSENVRKNRRTGIFEEVGPAG